MENKLIRNTKCAGGVVVNNDNKILVVSQGGRTWSLPKGHIDEGEDELDTAKREIYEESGIKDLKLIKNLGNYQRYRLARDSGEDESELKTITIFLFRTSESILKPIDPENPEARWVEKDKVADLLTHKKDKEFFLQVKEEI
ncbi:MAG: NUDIX domain-containing protein [Patescibacteria group bacterium]|jgi:ADP-ribose pyrophosphatase YjhB (NUDIX family)